MRHRLLSRVVTLVLVSAVVLPSAAQGASHHRLKAHKADAAACAAVHVAVTASTLQSASSATLCLLNVERAKHGLKPLRLNTKLARAARAHTVDMVRNTYFEHNSLDGRTPFTRMLATDYVPRGASWTLGENIGWGTEELGQPSALVDAWMRSPGHRANILNGKFREIGIGIQPGVPVDDRDVAGQPGATYTTDFGAHS
ncbi:MAG TPA: CAP domain-containing protein [Conexibacter sp.]|jgi:uncharacterized protein YkwD